jgi:PTS system mannose-specific IIA component
MVCHGTVAECMMDAIQGILGKQTGWKAVSNRGLGLKELGAAARAAVEDLSASHEVIVFSDMPGGSCHHACQELAREMKGVRVVSGLNLMMLLEFFVKRDRTELDALLGLILERGRDSVRLT